METNLATDEFPRHLEESLRESLAYFRVVVVTGARQSGKTTLVRKVAGAHSTLVRLDRPSDLDVVLADPETAAQQGPTPRVFDEVQRGGDPLVRAIKMVVDDDQTPGQFLLNGSAGFLTTPMLTESLAGRAVFLELWPLTQGEIEGHPDRFLNQAFTDPEQLVSDDLSPHSSSDYLQRVCRGGFPEVVKLPEKLRAAWFRSYVRAVAERDITDFTGARQAQFLPKMLALLAARTANELVAAHIHDETGLGSRTTTDDYLSHLQMVYLVHLLPAWSRGLTAKVVRRPKVHVADSGLAAFLLRKDPVSLIRPTDPARGMLLETFVANELLRQSSWLGFDVRLHHFRDRDGNEIDLIAEALDGRVVAVEVKAASAVSLRDARQLRWLRNKIGNDFVCGVVFHTGERSFRLDQDIYALPISALWRTP
ncbi:MAG: ATP-binding protein [Acidimicrobiia bacterium]|nr:ATP-binding protein [Acidimicrobiia bacterium]